MARSEHDCVFCECAEDEACSIDHQTHFIVRLPRGGQLGGNSKQCAVFSGHHAYSFMAVMAAHDPILANPLRSCQRGPIFFANPLCRNQLRSFARLDGGRRKMSALGNCDYWAGIVRGSGRNSRQRMLLFVGFLTAW